MTISSSSAKKPSSPQVIYKTVYVEKPAPPMTWPPLVRVEAELSPIYTTPDMAPETLAGSSFRYATWRVIGDAGAMWKVEGYVPKINCTEQRHG